MACFQLGGKVDVSQFGSNAYSFNSPKKKIKKKKILISERQAKKDLWSNDL